MECPICKSEEARSSGLSEVDALMTIEKWLNKFIDENELNREHVFRIEHEGAVHSMKFNIVTDSIISLPAEYQKKIKNRLVTIDSEKGDLMHYLNWVAEGFIKYKAEV